MTETPTPLERAPDAVAGGRTVYLKREDVHEIGAFKWRGALPALKGFAAAGATTVVTASTGNHGAATAWAGRELGVRVVVFVPERASVTKTKRIASLGAELRHEGDDVDEAKVHAAAFATERGLVHFEDGAEPSQYEGYATIGQEIASQLRDTPATVVVPVGGGALIGGVGNALSGGSTEIVGVVAKDAPVMADCFEAGRVVATTRCATIADGLAVRVAIPYAVERVQTVVDRMVRISEREMARAIGRFADVGIRVEASAAAALAGLDHLERPAEPIVLVITGRNIDDDLFERARTDPDSFAA